MLVIYDFKKVEEVLLKDCTWKLQHFLAFKVTMQQFNLLKKYCKKQVNSGSIKIKMF